MRTDLSAGSAGASAARRLRLAVRHAPVLLPALGWVALVRAGLTVAPHRVMRILLLPSRRFAGPDAPRAARTAWAVHHVARIVPGATCLTQALAAQVMLARRGLVSTLHLGVDPARSGAFEAHAWLEADGRVLLGGTREGLAGYSRLVSYGPVAYGTQAP